jgi:hypothetical protein
MPGALVAGRVSDRSRRARVRFMMGFGLTVNMLMFTIVGSAEHAGYTPLALAVSAVGIFATTWFLLDVGIAYQADAQRRRNLRRS